MLLYFPFAVARNVYCWEHVEASLHELFDLFVVNLFKIRSLPVLDCFLEGAIVVPKSFKNECSQVDLPKRDAQRIEIVLERLQWVILAKVVVPATVTPVPAYGEVYRASSAAIMVFAQSQRIGRPSRSRECFGASHPRE